MLSIEESNNNKGIFNLIKIQELIILIIKLDINGDGDLIPKMIKFSAFESLIPQTLQSNPSYCNLWVHALL